MSDLIDRRSELCKTCIHTKVCMKDKNLVGDVFVMGHPMMFDNDKLYEEYKERERQGFPCEDYMQTAQPEIIRCKECKWSYDDISGRICSHGVCVDCVVSDDFYCADAERRTDDLQ